MDEQAASDARHVVVVVEDEVLVRLVACQALEEAGFLVVEAQHADEAIAVLRARAADVRAVFTDIHMPGSMDGMALAHLSRRSWPWIVLLIASGRARPRPDEMPEGSRFLPKPYDANHAIGHLRQMLAT